MQCLPHQRFSSSICLWGSNVLGLEMMNFLLAQERLGVRAVSCFPNAFSGEPTTCLYNPHGDVPTVGGLKVVAGTQYAGAISSANGMGQVTLPIGFDRGVLACFIRPELYGLTPMCEVQALAYPYTTSTNQIAILVSPLKSALEIVIYMGGSFAFSYVAVGW